MTDESQNRDWTEREPIRFEPSDHLAPSPLPPHTEGEPEFALPADHFENPVAESTPALEVVGAAGEPSEDETQSEQHTVPSAPVSIFALRLAALTDAIERYPSTPVNYVLRGELHVEMGQMASASADFERALELAEERFESLTWGYVNASLIDRARAGLRLVSHAVPARTPAKVE